MKSMPCHCPAHRPNTSKSAGKLGTSLLAHLPAISHPWGVEGGSGYEMTGALRLLISNKTDVQLQGNAITHYANYDCKDLLHVCVFLSRPFLIVDIFYSIKP